LKPIKFFYRRYEGSHLTKFAGIRLVGKKAQINQRLKNCQNVMQGNVQTLGGIGKTDMKKLV
jgi:hypothetical protein